MHDGKNDDAMDGGNGPLPTTALGLEPPRLREPADARRPTRTGGSPPKFAQLQRNQRGLKSVVLREAKILRLSSTRHPASIQG